MCGIFAYFGPNSENYSSKASIEKLEKHLSKRGRDSFDFHTDENHFLSHSRLAIYDTTKNSQQPFFSECKNYQLIFNGSIYNFEYLKKNFLSNYKFRTNGDTEVLLQGLIEYKSSFIKHLRGSWSFVFIDKKNKDVIVSRDTFGEKPLYYKYDNNEFIFSSSLFAILDFQSSMEIEYKNFQRYLIYGLSRNGLDTFVKGIKVFDPNQYLTFKLGAEKNSFSFSKIFKNDFDSQFHNFSLEKESLLEKNLESACNEIQKADVPVTATTSGGIDSSLLASFLNNISKSFCADVTGDSSEYLNAKRIENSTNLKVNKISTKSEDLIKHLNNCICAQEEPFDSPSVLLQFHIYKEISKDGYRVVIEGQGADELFLGYSRYLPFYLLELIRSFKLFKSAKVFYLMTKNDKNFSRTNYFLSFFYFNFSFLKSLYIYFKNGIPLKNFLFFDYSTTEPLGKKHWRNKEIENNLTNLLNIADKNSMFNNIEVRLPYLYREVSKIAIESNTEVLLKDNLFKSPLRFILKKKNLNEISNDKLKFGYQPNNSEVISILKNSLSLKDIDEKWIREINILFGKDLQSLKDDFFFRSLVFLHWIRCLSEETDLNKNIFLKN